MKSESTTQYDWRHVQLLAEAIEECAEVSPGGVYDDEIICMQYATTPQYKWRITRKQAGEKPLLVFSLRMRTLRAESRVGTFRITEDVYAHVMATWAFLKGAYASQRQHSIMRMTP